MYKLENTYEMNAKHPSTFHLPPTESLSKLEPGDTAKCIFIPAQGVSERMWIHITSVSGRGRFTGTLSNCPGPDLEPLEYGSIVHFGLENISDFIFNDGPADDSGSED